MNHDIFIPTETKFKEILKDTVDSLLEQRIPEIIRRSNRKEIMTTAELKELTGMSARMQKYHRDEGNLPFSQTGRKIFYMTTDVEEFIDERRIEPV